MKIDHNSTQDKGHMYSINLILKKKAETSPKIYRHFLIYMVLLMATLLAFGCAHYPVNPPIKAYRPGAGYRGKHVKAPGNSDKMLLLLTFSGGGTRAAALSFGVLEVLKDTEVTIDGVKRRLLDEVDGISSVSGGSFTAGYYGLFGDRIFQDFENKFLKKNIQGALTIRTFLNPVNWFRLYSDTFDRSDLAAEYYDKHIFEGGTFGDLANRKGPIIVINATEMTHGTRIGFTQDWFDVICSDLSKFPVARACSASSAVPMLMSPITLRNYAGTCGYKIPDGYEELLKGHEISARQFYLANKIEPLLESREKPYLHLVDGGVTDNLGLRAILDRVILRGSFWESIKGTPVEKVHKVIFIVVNAETQPDTKWDKLESPPPFGAMVSSYASIAVEQYNKETIALLRESLKSWSDEVRTQRCKGEEISRESGSCGDIKIYLIEVNFDSLKDQKERRYFKRLPTSFKLTSEQVDKLREVAHRIIAESPEFQQLLNDLK